MGTELLKKQNFLLPKKQMHFATSSKAMRKRRELVVDGRYHVSARANRQEMILDKESMKELFLNVVACAKKKFDFRIENFCVMGNHFHLIIQPLNGANLSRIMQWILSVFAMKWNKMHGITGHVWGERFFSRVISCIVEFMQVFRYIIMNPVKAGMASQSKEWKHCGLWHYQRSFKHILDVPPLWLSVIYRGFI